MNIKLLDSWLREYLHTSATPERIAKELSLTSVSIERLEKFKDELVYDIEVTTNRPDLASVTGLAREAAAVLPQQGIQATFKPLVITDTSVDVETISTESVKLQIDNDPSLLNRICAVVMEVTQHQSTQQIKDRLESSDIRSLNNIVDITNYVMRVTGQPTHVMDYDRVGSYLKIRKAKKGEKVTTLDNKTYALSGGDIVAVNKKNEIVDLLGIMGLENTVVTEKTKRILFFINNFDPTSVRKTSMEHGIRTEAVQLNEKHLDPQLCMVALRYGMQLYQELANANVIGDVIDIYPNPPQRVEVHVSEEKINRVIGVAIPLRQSADILTHLGFDVTIKGKILHAIVPTFRLHDVSLPEDLIEEIARVYGYHNLPVALPEMLPTQTIQQSNNPFYWEQRVKAALKYWGFTELYTYSMVAENLYEGPLEHAVTIANPLNEEFVYMRQSIVPSMLQIVSENKQKDTLMLFEVANVYYKKEHQLPQEIRHIAGVIKHSTLSFFVVKGYIEQLFKDLGIKTFAFRPISQAGDGAEIYIDHTHIGNIEILDDNLMDFEIDFDEVIRHASLKKTYTPPSKFPPIFEDITLDGHTDTLTQDLISLIKKQSTLIRDVSLVTKYGNNRTFHIMYQDERKNLTTEEVKKIHDKILIALK